MDWQKGRTSGIEDRRGSGPSGPQMAGGGFVAVLIGLAAYYFFGADPQAVTEAINQMQGGSAATSGQTSVTAASDEQSQFIDVIHTSANDVWAETFAASGRDYNRSTMVLYNGGTSTACGMGQAQMGPFYCPGDQRVYLDLQFLDVMDQKLGAKGDFAVAYVIAHEVGHHVQNVLGYSAKVQQMQSRMNERDANALSVRLELQADCYAGVWAKKSNNELHWLDGTDLQEAINAASAVGDDTLQRASTGRVVPDAFTHGTSEQRMRWFRTGYEGASPKVCDTFSGAV